MASAGLRRAAAGTLTTSLTVAGLGFIAVTLVGRLLGPEGRGEVTAFQLIPSIAAIVVAVGLPHASTYFTARDPERATSIVRRHAGLAALSGTVGAALTALIVWQFLDAEHDVVVAGVIFSASVLLIVVTGTLVHPLRSVGRYRRWNLTRLFVESSITAAAVYVLAGGRSVRLMAIVQVVWLLGCLGLAYLPWRGRALVDEGVPSRRAILGFGLPTMLATLPAFLNFRLDQLVMQATRSTRELGLYATAVTWSAASLPIVNTMSNLTLPYLAGLEQGRTWATGKLMRVTLLVALCCAAVFCLAAPAAILVLSGAEFRASIGMAMVLAWSTALLGVVSTAEEALRAHGDVRFPARAQLTGLAVNLVLLVVLVPAIGAWGAVLASTTCYLVVTMVVLRRVAVTSGLANRDLLPRGADLRTMRDAVLRRPVRSAEVLP